MSDKMRWRYGDTNSVVSTVDKATSHEIGDLMFLDPYGDAKPASVLISEMAGRYEEQYEEWQEAFQPSVGPDEEVIVALADSKEIPQGIFARHFLGVAMQRSQSGDTDPIRLASTGVFEFNCPRLTFGLGDLVGPEVANVTACQDCRTVLTKDYQTAVKVCPTCGSKPDGTTVQVLSQAVAPVDSPRLAIARVAKLVRAVSDSVLVEIRSTVMTGGIAGSVAHEE